MAGGALDGPARPQLFVAPESFRGRVSTRRASWAGLSRMFCPGSGPGLQVLSSAAIRTSRPGGQYGFRTSDFCISSNGMRCTMPNTAGLSTRIAARSLMSKNRR